MRMKNHKHPKTKMLTPLTKKVKLLKIRQIQLDKQTIRVKSKRARRNGKRKRKERIRATLQILWLPQTNKKSLCHKPQFLTVKKIYRRV